MNWKGQGEGSFGFDFLPQVIQLAYLHLQVKKPFPAGFDAYLLVFAMQVHRFFQPVYLVQVPHVDDGRT